MRAFLSFAFFILLTLPRLQAQAVAISGDLLIMLEPGASAHKVADELSTWNGVPTGMRVVEEVSKPMRTWLLRFDPARVGQFDMLRAARSLKDVRLAQNNHHLELREVPNDTQYGQQWHHQNINSEAAWDISTGGVTADGDTIVVCIIENADLPHADLIANAWYNHQEIPGNGVDDDGNGYVDDYRGWNPNSQTDQVYGGTHGTQVAGMIGASGNNATGVVGANWNVKMMLVFNSGANDSGVLASHSYPLTMRRIYNQTQGASGAFVVATNGSWGINGGQPADAPIWCAMYDSLGTVGILGCGATANNNVDVDMVGDLPTACPSNYMISVTATDSNDQRTFSGYGLTTIDVGAPGEDVYTTRVGNTYGTNSGTSFATPLTAGVIGLLYSAPCPGLMALVKNDPQQGALHIREALFDGVDQVGNLPGQTVTGGRINAGTSMQLIMNDCGPCPAPYGIAAHHVDINTALITWASASGVSYDLDHRMVGANEWITTEGITQTQHQLSDLEHCVPYELRIRCHCGSDSSAYSTLFTWTSEGCCSAPWGPLSTTPASDMVTLAWQHVLAANTYDVQYAPLGTTDHDTITGITDTTVVIAALDPCRTYTVQVRSVCDDTSTEWSAPTIVRTTGCGSCTDLAYCPTTGGNTSSEWIDRVELGDLDHDSGSDGGYGDHTDLSVDLEVDREYIIRLHPGFNAFQFDEWFHVWMDLDQNGEFDQPGELVFDSEQADNAPAEGPITVPASTALGATRMRVIMRYGESPDQPCATNLDYGEVEDYCVNVILNTGAGVPEPSYTTGVLFFPLPAGPTVTMRMVTCTPGSTLTLVDATGRLVFSTPLTAAERILNIGHLAPGTYTALVAHGQRVVERGRLVVADTR